MSLHSDLYNKILDDHKELSSLPQTLSEVIRVVRDEQASTQQLADVIMRDPGLTAKILQIVNSPIYGAGREITTVSQAVMTMGFRAVSALALSTSIYHMTGDWDLTIDRTTFWRHSLEVAIGARMIAQEIGYPSPEEAFIVGLLHDIGILVLEKSFPEKFDRIWKQTSSGEKLHELEDQTWGTNHARVGQFLLEQWNLPTVLCDAVGHHHLDFVPTSDEPELRLTRIVVLSNLISRFTITKVPADLACDRDHRESLCTSLGLETASLRSIQEKLLAQTVEEARFLEIDIGSPQDILLEANRMIYQQYATVESLLSEKQELQQEVSRTKMEKAALETLKTISATFNHYINNAAATILGRAQLVQVGLKNSEITDKKGSVALAMDVIIRGVDTIGTVMDELKNLSDFKTTVYHDDTYIIDIENKIKKQLENLRESTVPVP